jgi:hypothetical protein
MKTQHDLFEAITYGAVQRVRPKLMTVCMITFGLVPALWAHGAGAEAIQRIAAPMVGGLITSTILTLEIVPAIYSLWRGRQVEWVKGPRPPRKSWGELSDQFVSMERAGHHDAVSPTPGAPIGESPKPVETAILSQSRRKFLWWILIPLVAVIAFVVWRASRPAGDKTMPTVQSATGAAQLPAFPKLELTDPQLNAARDFIAAAAAVSESLAADDLAGFNRAAPQAGAALNGLQQTLPPAHAWRPLLQKIADNGKLVPAGDLAEARKAFLPFSIAVTEFIRVARQQSEELRSVKVYRCPMAPQPGFWIQQQGPLRNPYFGDEMLDCGTEIIR